MRPSNTYKRARGDSLWKNKKMCDQICSLKVFEKIETENLSNILSIIQSRLGQLDKL